MRKRATLPDIKGVDPRAINPGGSYPFRIINFRRGSFGGLLPRGRLVGRGVQILPQVVGTDEQGLVTYLNTGGNIALMQNGVIRNFPTMQYSPDYGAHIPSAGWYINPYSDFHNAQANMALKKIDNTYVIPNTDYSIPLDASNGLITTSGGRLQSARYNVLLIFHQRTRAGKVAIAARRYQGFILNTGDQKQFSIYISAKTAGTFLDIYVQPIGLGVDDFIHLGNYDVSANKTILIPDLPVGTILGQKGATLVRYDPTLPVTLHNERIWGRFGRPAGNFGTDGQSRVYPDATGNPLALNFTEKSWINLVAQENYIVLDAQSSEQITGLASIARSSMLAFCDHECFELYGDLGYQTDSFRMLENFGVRRHPRPIGCDKGIRPVVLGGEAYVIWRGSVYRVSAGEALHISMPIDQPGIRFIDLAVDTYNRFVIALDSQRQTWIYESETNEWFNGPTNPRGVSLPFDRLVSGTDVYGVRMFRNQFGLLTPYVIDGEVDIGLDTSIIEYLRVDLGDPRRIKSFLKVSLYADEAHAPSVSLRVGFREREWTVTAVQSGEYLVFELPPGVTNEWIDLRISFSTPRIRTFISPPVIIEYIERGESHAL